MNVEIRIKSKKSFDDLCSEVPKKVSEAGFGVLAEIKTSDVLKSKGYEYALLRTFEICNPEYASKILNTDIRFESMLPCRIVIKGTKDGSEVIGLLPEAMAGLVGNRDADETMLKVQELVKKIVKNIAE